MRFKPVPEPPADLAAVETIRRTLPAAAGDADDCCQLLVDETPLETRDEAATWLTFLRALELATEEPAGFRRRDPGSSAETDSDTPSALEPDRLRRAFRERVDGADAVLSALERADGSLTASEIATAVREERRQSGERGRRPIRAEEKQRERIERLLEWAVLLDLAEKTEDGYRSAPTRG
ncbi:hypothetical protein CP556_11905 [Natrinema sp. CBA1119]|uniref:hypothetical protein n=1 Tax=Natrinema sp. CBA1119 TaxID=1608465 RepID=UPI000BF8A53E|nr:hypothetical protein [Natrinema sp. CBA1119]PGF16749.1 hypothetical protein CP556_11905 [Natrinema sp. CBA1119]